MSGLNVKLQNGGTVNINTGEHFDNIKKKLGEDIGNFFESIDNGNKILDANEIDKLKSKLIEKNYKVEVAADGNTPAKAYNAAIQNIRSKYDPEKLKKDFKTEEADLHEIKRGDSLYAIAKNALRKEGLPHDARSINERIGQIACLNNINDVNNVKVGTKLIVNLAAPEAIPPKAVVAENKPAPKISKAEPKQNPKISHSSAKNLHWTQMSDEQMREIYGNYSRDITTPYSGNAEDLNRYLKGKGVLSGQGQAFIDAQNKYGISAAVLAGIAISESGGTSSLARKRFNVTSISSSRGWRRFNNVSECIDYTASMLANRYVKNSGLSGVSLKTLYQINAKYCPVSDTRNNSSNNRFWAQNVENKVREIEKA